MSFRCVFLVGPSGLKRPARLGLFAQLSVLLWLLTRGPARRSALVVVLFVQLERGYIGVVNRSQQDINDGVTIAEAHEHEAAYFRRHPAYRHMSGRMGSKFLARMLNQVLLQHARECLPSLKARIGSMLSEIQAELSELGDPVSGLNMRVKGELLLMLLSKYATAFTTTVDGTSDEVVAGVGGHVVDHMGVGRRGSPDEMDTVLAGGARIAFVFNDVFTRAMMVRCACSWVGGIVEWHVSEPLLAGNTCGGLTAFLFWCFGTGGRFPSFCLACLCAEHPPVR